MNNYYVKITCGAYKAPALSRLMLGMQADKEFQIAGNMSLEDVQMMIASIAASTYEETDKKVRAAGKVLPDGVANGFIFEDGHIIAGVSVFLEGEKPRIEYIDKESIDRILSPAPRMPH